MDIIFAIALHLRWRCIEWSADDALLAHSTNISARNIVIAWDRFTAASLLALCLLAVLADSRQAYATPVYAAGHADIGVNYVTTGGPHLTLRTRFDGDAMSENPLDPYDIRNQIFPAEAVAIRVRDDDPPRLRERKVDEETMEVLYDLTGPEWDFLGVAQGEPIWTLPQTSEVGKPFFGFATDNLFPPSQWNGPISFALEEIVSGPAGGEVSMWQSDFFGQPTVMFASADGIGEDDDFTQTIGGHDHYNWGFSKPGVYQICLGAYANRVGVGQVQGTGVFTFLVGDAAGASLTGDYDANGVVNGNDFLLWQRTFGSTVTAGSGADGSGNGLIDAADLDLWRNNFGAGGGAARPVAASVPEPSSVALLLGLCASIRLFAVKRITG